MNRNTLRARSTTADGQMVPTPAVNGVPVAPPPGTVVSPGPEEFASGDVAYGYAYPDFSPGIELNNLQLQGTTTAPAYIPATYYFNTPFVTYDSERTKEMLRSQIEYYFSEENLQRDFFLRRKMDEQGFLPVSLIASFHRVQALTQDVTLVVDSLANSTAVEVVDGIKVRTRINPEKWPIVSLLDF